MNLAEVLRARGGRLTQARQQVWDALGQIGGHATVQDIVEVLDATSVGDTSQHRSCTAGDARSGDHRESVAPVNSQRSDPAGDNAGADTDGADTAPINQSSVYRALQLFADLGLVRESRTGPLGVSTWERRHPDGEIHVVCNRCHAVDHHRTAHVEHLRHELTAAGFAPGTIDVRVDGVCPRCHPE